MIIEVISFALMAAGFFFFFATTVGVLRFPDFYSRMHAAGKGDTLSSLLMICGLALYNLHHLSLAAVLVSIKILLITAFIFIASPTATMAIIDAGFDSRISPWTKKKAEDSEDDLAT